ncbi:MAG: type I-E CRISPR-associated endonuclease Cas1e [Burkholderiales bacterium]|nr:type I-E CRISPR-associated endonuclease Cas1e [Burkholderiales bacterium]
MAVSNLKTLARYTDSVSFLYLEHAVIEKDNQSVAAFTADGRISLPVANLSVLMLGPGTRVTHAAVSVLASSGCLLVWVGEEGLRHYASGQQKTRSSAPLERQCLVWSDPGKRMQTVRRLYEMRFKEPVPASLTLQQIRGREGARVRDAYRDLSQRFGVEWSGRVYQVGDWKAADPVNRAMSATNAALYAVVLAGLHSLGYSPGLGFIHTGKQLSFVYDLADVFKMETSVPAAFEAAASGASKIEARARAIFRTRAAEHRLLDRINSTLTALFGKDDQANQYIEGDDFDMNAAIPGSLWDPAGNVSGGSQHAGDDT